MSQELQPRICQCDHNITFYSARDIHGFKRPVGGFYAVEGAGAAFGEEGGAVGGFGFEDLVGLGEGGPGGEGFGTWWWEVNWRRSIIL